MAELRNERCNGPRGRGGGLLPCHLKIDGCVGIGKYNDEFNQNKETISWKKRENMTWEEIDEQEDDYDVTRLLKKGKKDKNTSKDKLSEATRKKQCAPKKNIDWK